MRDASVCATTAAAAFRNQRKLEAIVEGAAMIASSGFVRYFDQVESRPIETLQRLPFIGPITVWHLAKNLGFHVAKPDRPLERLSASFGYTSTATLCEAIADETGDRLDVIDAVLWRYAVMPESSVAP